MELLIVIAIIAILAAVVLISLNSGTQQAREARGLQFSKNIKSANATDLIGEWTFDDQDNCNRDNSGNNPDASLTGTTCADSCISDGRVRGAFYFDGVDDRFIIVGSSSLEPSSITIETWARLSDIGNRHILVTKWYGYSLEINPSGYPYFRLRGVSPGDSYSTKSISWDDWHHIAVSFDNDNKQTRVYVDTFETTRNVAGSISYTPNASLVIPYSPTYIKGNLDEVRIYKRALSAKEIKKLYAEGAKRYFADR